MDRAARLIDGRTNWLGLDEAGLAADLAGILPGEERVANEVFSRLSSSDRDDVAYFLASMLSDNALAEMAPHSEGSALLKRMIAEMQDGATTDQEQEQILRLVLLLYPTHQWLITAPWLRGDEVKSALQRANASPQTVSDGHGDLILDEYSIVVEQMGLVLDGVFDALSGLRGTVEGQALRLRRQLPEEFVDRMRASLNDAARNETFNAINVFAWRMNVRPTRGAICDIDILGPDNGSVMLVVTQPRRFVFQIVKTARYGSHPENGAREFGCERLADGRILFYTRGASRSGNVMDVVPGYGVGSSAVGAAGAVPQNKGWTALLKGIGREIERMGGRTNEGSFAYWTTHRAFLRGDVERPLAM
jgi:hypothetical protein